MTTAAVKPPPVPEWKLRWNLKQEKGSAEIKTKSQVGRSLLPKHHL